MNGTLDGDFERSPWPLGGVTLDRSKLGGRLLVLRGRPPPA